MLSYLLALIGITLLCAAWVKFQLWLKKESDDDCADYSPGCGACKVSECSKKQSAL